MSLQFVLSAKGKPKVNWKGFLFIKERAIGDKIFWKCEMYTKTSCRCRIMTVGDNVIEEKQEHNHAGDAAQVEVALVLNAIRNEALNSPASVDDTELYTSVISRASFGISEAAAVKLPCERSMHRMIRNLRNKSDPPPPIPTCCEMVVFSESLRKTDNGEQFLIYDSGAVRDRIVIFSTRRNLQLLARSEHWYADGTFETVPSPFSRVFTVHSVQANDSVPLVYALLPDKSEQSYARVLMQIKELEPESNPRIIWTDYEIPVISSVSEVFPNAICRGCFYHLCQIIYRKIQEFGFKQWYDTDSVFALNMRMIPAIALVPAAHACEAFEYLLDNVSFPAEVMPILDFFDDTFLGRPDKRFGRRPPKYNIDMWNCYGGVQQGLPKINTMIEGWHRVFQQKISLDKPCIWKLVRAIKKEQGSHEIRIKQYISGEQPSAKQKVDRSVESLKRICGSFDPSIDMLEYLRDVACNINY